MTRRLRGHHAQRAVARLGALALAIALTRSHAFVLGVEASEECARVEPVDPFDLDAYVEAEWYVAAQKPTSYQPTRDLFCVRANYTVVDERTISIWNTANRDGVDGSPRNADGRFKLRGLIEDPNMPSKIAVGMRFLPRFLYGPYWVVATDVSPGDAEFDERGYSWAIISGGQPTISRGNGLCEPSGGLWLFVRDPEVSEEVVSKMKEKCESLGIDPDVLIPVTQEGCSFPTLP